MEVRLGYKHTSVGKIPETWNVDSLEKFWSVTDCKHVTARFIYDGYPLASIREVQSRFVELANAKQTTQQFYKLLIDGGRKPQAGDLIISRNATVGEVAQVADWHPPFAMGQDVCLLRKRDLGYSTDFLQAVFGSSIIANQLSDLMVGSTFKRINVQQIKSFIVPMPPTIEQRAIAEALSDVDALLDGLERLIAKKRDLKQASMQQLLTGQTRLPGFSGEWVVKRMGDIGEISGAGVDKKIDPNEFRVRLLNYMDVYRKDFLKSNDFSHEVTAKPEQARRCSVQRGDVFFTPTSEVRYDIGHSAIAVEDIPDVVYSYHLVRLRLFESWDIPFRAYAFKSKYFMDQAITQCEGSGTRYVITLPKFRAMTIRFPVDVAEQTAIATILSDMDAEIAALEARRDKTRALKQGMMQELLTGRTRLV
jgi:type I restriction enzyme S subunit